MRTSQLLNSSHRFSASLVTIRGVSAPAPCAAVFFLNVLTENRED